MTQKIFIAGMFLPAFLVLAAVGENNNLSAEYVPQSSLFNLC